MTNSGWTDSGWNETARYEPGNGANPMSAPPMSAPPMDAPAWAGGAPPPGQSGPDQGQLPGMMRGPAMGEGQRGTEQASQAGDMNLAEVLQEMSRKPGVSE